MSRTRITCGLLIWLVGLICCGYLIRCFLLSDQPRLTDQLWQFFSAERVMVSLDVPPTVPVQVGDPIYWIRSDQSVEQVGEVQQINMDARQPSAGAANRSVAVALFYPSAPPIGESSQVIYYSTRDSLSWVIETILPPEKRQQIAQEISATYVAHRVQILQALQPIVATSLTEAWQIIEQDLAVAVSRHRDELAQLSNRYQQQIVEQELLPLVRREIWPIVRRHAEPLATEIGQAMWQRASLWRFGWRYLYDKLPLSEEQLMRDEWNRFIQQEGVPILKRYADDIVAAQQQILSEVSRNPEVRAAVRNHLAQVMDDPEFRTIVWNMMREILVDNPRLQATFEEHWQGEEARRAVELAASYLEPCARRIGDLLLGTREEGISPEFAQILRNQILGKDRRWLVLQASTDAAADKLPTPATRLAVVRGGRPRVNPFSIQLQKNHR